MSSDRTFHVDVFEPASDYDYGFTAARERPLLYRRLVGAGLALWKRHLCRGAGPQPSWRAHRRLADERYPASGERLLGISRGAGIAEDELSLAAGVLNSVLVPRCTDFAVSPPATADGGVYVSWNVDITPLLKLILGRSALFVLRLPDRKPYVSFGLPALLGLGVLNGDGLAMAANAVGMTDGGDGLHTAELNNMAMETCASVDEVVGLYNDNPREAFVGNTITILLNANSTWADPSGSLATVEYSHNHIAVKRSEGGFLAEANHHQYLDHSLSGGVDPSQQLAIAGSYARLGRMLELLDEYDGRMTPALCRRVASDHGTNYSLLEPFGISRQWHEGPIDDGTICTHFWNAWDHAKHGRLLDAFVVVATSCTAYQMVMAPKALCIYFCYGWPCRNPHVPMYFGDLLDSQPAEPELASGVARPKVKVRHSSPYLTSFDWPLSPSDEKLRGRLRSGAERLDRLMDVE